MRSCQVVKSSRFVGREPCRILALRRLDGLPLQRSEVSKYSARYNDDTVCACQTYPHALVGNMQCSTKRAVARVSSSGGAAEVCKWRRLGCEHCWASVVPGWRERSRPGHRVFGRTRDERERNRKRQKEGKPNLETRVDRMNCESRGREDSVCCCCCCC